MLLLHPEVATRSCDDCRKWIYKANGERLEKRGVPMARPQGTPTPCATCPKIPADAPIRDSCHAVDLSEQNLKAYWHYQQHKATGQFPDDPIVRRNAAIIAGVLKFIDDLRLDRLFFLLGGKL